MRIVVACDCYIRPEMLDGVFSLEQYGCVVVPFDNPLLSTKELEGEVMLRTEKEGADAVEAGEGLLDAVRTADILMVQMSPVNTQVIRAAQNLKLVGVMRGGCDNVNTQLLKELHIPVVHAPNRSAYAVADYTVGMIIAETKNIARGHYELRQGCWKTDFSNSCHCTDMRNRTIGIIGYGHIGRLVAQELSGFGCEILVHDPYQNFAAAQSTDISAVTLEELLQRCDIVTLHLRCSETTKGFIGERELELMRPDATLINTARAGLVDQAALIRALKEHKILGAAIDVFDEEPLPPENPYRYLDNLTITPHLAGLSNDTFKNGLDTVTEDVERFLKGQILRFPL